MTDKKIVKLTTISEYATYHNISRPTVYELIDSGKLTRYEDQDKNPMLNLNERPFGVKRYGKIRKRRIV